MDDYIKLEDAISDIDKAFENAEKGKTSMTKMLLSAAQLTVRSILRDMPAADVVEVVRCKNCTYLEANDEYDYFLCEEHGGLVTPESYCSFAERKEVKEDG